MPLLLAIRRQRTDYVVREVMLSRSVQDDVRQEFLRQEEVFRTDTSERPFDQNWQLDSDEIATTSTDAFPLFEQIARVTDTTVEPLQRNELEGVHGLAIRFEDRVLIQAFSSALILNRRGLLALILQEETYSRLESGVFRLADKLLCIVESGLLKFKSIHTLGRLIDTSAIFNEATNVEVQDFVDANSSLFHFGDIDRFLSNTNRNARKYISSVIASAALNDQTVPALQAAMEETGLNVTIHDGKIVMPTDSRRITEVMRFLNDGRYVGPVSGATFITNSRRAISGG